MSEMKAAQHKLMVVVVLVVEEEEEEEDGWEGVEQRGVEAGEIGDAVYPAGWGWLRGHIDMEIAQPPYLTQPSPTGRAESELTAVDPRLLCCLCCLCCTLKWPSGSASIRRCCCGS